MKKPQDQIVCTEVKTMGELSEWLAERGLKMKPRYCGAMHAVELRKAGQPHVAKALVIGSGLDWEVATRDALYKYEAREKATVKNA